MERIALSKLILFFLFITILHLEVKSQDVIECHDNNYRFLWQGELIEDESISYACGSNLPEIIEIVYSNGQPMTYVVTWTGLVSPNGPNLDGSQANVQLADFGSNPYTQANINGEFLDGLGQQHSLSIRLLYLGPFEINPNREEENYNYEYDKNKTVFYSTHLTYPEPGIPIKLISNLKGSYSDKVKYYFKSEEIASFGELFCNDQNLIITPFNNFLKEGEINFEYTAPLSTNTLELDIWDCGEIPLMKVFLGKPIEKKVDFVYVGRDATHKPNSLQLTELLENANVILNKVGINLTLGNINPDIPIFYVPDISGLSNYDYQFPYGILNQTEQWALYNHYIGSNFWQHEYLVMIVEDLGMDPSTNSLVIGNASGDGGQLDITNSVALDAFDVKANMIRGGIILAHELGHAAYTLYHTNQKNIYSPIDPHIDSDFRNLMNTSTTGITRRLNAFQFKQIHTIR